MSDIEEQRKHYERLLHTVCAEYCMRIADLEAENAKLRELVRRMFYAVHPADREKFLTNVAELGVEV